MGIYASGGVEISFTKEEDANKVYEILSNNEVAKQIIKIIGEEGEGNYNLYDFDGDGEWLYFKVSSGRVQNAEWQVEKIIDVLKVLIKDKVIGSIECFHSHLMTEYNSWDIDGKDFDAN
mgnify:CR=1 FL=1|tara:strand:+ start:331 stop:687 length:357 start_codon:yes stop_codon:yes gene_type:complete